MSAFGGKADLDTDQLVRKSGGFAVRTLWPQYPSTSPPPSMLNAGRTGCPPSAFRRGQRPVTPRGGPVVAGRNRAIGLFSLDHHGLARIANLKNQDLGGYART